MHRSCTGRTARCCYDLLALGCGIVWLEEPAGLNSELFLEAARSLTDGCMGDLFPLPDLVSGGERRCRDEGI